MATTSATATDTASAILAADVRRKGMLIRNFGSFTAYVSNDPAVNSANGFPILSGDTLTLEHDEGGINAHATLYAICAAAETTALRIWANS